MLEFTLGGRYFELKDQFWVDARGGNLGDSYWNTTSKNSIAGPELGIRYYKPLGRFGFSAEPVMCTSMRYSCVVWNAVMSNVGAGGAWAVTVWLQVACWPPDRTTTCAA